ncbi:MAG: ABC transporter permease [Dehalococcoidia bacterium]
MQGFIVRRLLSAGVVVTLVSVLVFIMMHLLPGDALVVKLGETGRIPAERMADLRRQMGIDAPLPVQYVRWVGQVLDGSLGHSLIYEGQTVRSRIVRALPVTVQFGLMAILAALVIGVPLGVLSAVFQDRPLDYLVRVLALTGLTLPSFWLGLIIIVFGTLYLGYKPPREYVRLLDDPARNLSMMWLPALILGYSLAASVMRMTRSTVLEALHEDYARTARAKGLTARAVVVRHVLRNALIPVITLVGNQAAFVFSGALILEILFGLPGMGQVTYLGITQRDYPQVQGNALVIGSFVVLLNLVVDLSYGVVDPRIRYS